MQRLRPWIVVLSAAALWAEAQGVAESTDAGKKAGTNWGERAYSGCVWTQTSSRGDSALEVLMLANGYARLRMYEESLEALATLEEDKLSQDARASVHWQRGSNYYQLAELEKAHHHWLLAIESGRLPLHRRASLWGSLMLLDFERGNYAEAAAHGEKSRADYFASDCINKDEQLVAELDLRFAKYLSHTERERALHFARSAVATAAPGTIDAADLEWVALLEAGPAPAPIPPTRRPWLETPPAPVSEDEVLRHVTWTKTYRKLILPPPEVLSTSADPTDLSPYWMTVGETVNTPPNIDALKLRLPKPTLPPPVVGEAPAQEANTSAGTEPPAG